MAVRVRDLCVLVRATSRRATTAAARSATPACRLAAWAGLVAEPVAAPPPRRRHWLILIPVVIVAGIVAVQLPSGLDQIESAPANQPPAVPIRHIPGDPLTAILAPRDGQCGTRAFVLRMAPDLGDIQLSLLLRPFFRGWTDTTPAVFVGSLDDFAREIDATEVVIGPGEIWAATGAGSARQIVPIKLPSGRIVWQTGGAAGGCGS